jgi:hypothetical protein
LIEEAAIQFNRDYFKIVAYVIAGGAQTTVQEIVQELNPEDNECEGSKQIGQDGMWTDENRNKLIDEMNHETAEEVNS